MTRYVVVKDTICGRPIYVASDEADAARFLDRIEKDTTMKAERRNSLFLRLSGSNHYDTYEVHAVPSWEPDTPLSDEESIIVK